MTIKEDRLAILRGMRAAVRLHRDLDICSQLGSSTRIDVNRTIVRCGAMLMFRPLESLLGAYFNEVGTRGIIVTTKRPIGVQRFTGAHELGHMVMDHDPHADDERMLRRSPIATPHNSTPIQEREADSFSSYFLFPRWLINKLLDQQAWTNSNFENPHTIYQASLRLGASFAATVYALERENILRRSQRSELLNVKPHLLKRELVGDFIPESWRNTDVWRITERDEGTVIEANRRDLFFLKLKENSGAGYLWTFDDLQDAGFVILKDAQAAKNPEPRFGENFRLVLGETRELKEGTYTLREIRPCNPLDNSRTLTVHFEKSKSDREGLYEPQLESLLKAQCRSS